MKKLIKAVIPGFIPDVLWRISESRKYRKWLKNGHLVPPPHLAKQQIISEYQNRFRAETFVETGTYKGDTVWAQRKNFRFMFSIEVDQDLFLKAVKRFRAYPYIKILHGDSGDTLKTLVPKLSSMSLFWLDGHYSGGVTGRGALDTPIKAELKTIFSSPFRHIILIDDARLFDGTNGYLTLAEVTAIATGNKYVFSCKDDVIRLIPEEMGM